MLYASAKHVAETPLYQPGPIRDMKNQQGEMTFQSDSESETTDSETDDAMDIDEVGRIE